jgi:indole-3-glycerol phosphate synthase
MSASAQATAYVNGGAAALSVLTEPSEFGGSAADLLEVAAAVQLPLLKKDFHVSPVQLIEARALGASAVLLIARALEPDALRDLAEYAQELGLEVLIEVRDVEELGRALEVQSAVIGVNNRNLETLIIDPDTSARLIPRIPTGRLAVAESGLSARVDVERAAQVGADAVLIGSAVSAAADPESALRALTGVQKVARGG